MPEETLTPVITPDEVTPETSQEEEAPKAKSAKKAKDEPHPLELENAALKAEIEALRAKLPKNVTARPGHKVVFISSRGVAAIKKDDGKYISGSVNGIPFEVRCDEQVEVADEVAEALRGVIEAQKA